MATPSLTDLKRRVALRLSLDRDQGDRQALPPRTGGQHGGGSHASHRVRLDVRRGKRPCARSGRAGSGATPAKRARTAPDPAAGPLRAEPGRAQRGADRGARREARRAEPDRGRVRASQSDLFRALRRLPWRAQEGRHGQGAHARPHARARLRLPAGVHHLRLARRHAELGHLGRADRGRGRSDGALPAERSRDAARVQPGADARDLGRARAGRGAPRRAAARPRYRQSVLGDLARRRPGRPDRRRHVRDRQRAGHRLRGAHLADLGVRPLSLRDRTRCQGRPDRSLDGPAAGRRHGQDRARGALGRDLQVRGLGGQVRHRRRLLAAAIRDHGRRHARAAQGRLDQRHDGRHPGVPSGAARRLDRRLALPPRVHRQCQGDRAYPAGELRGPRPTSRSPTSAPSASCTTAAWMPPAATSWWRPTPATGSR